MVKTNYQYFSKADVENGLHIKFIQFLLENFESEEYRVDIHVYNEDCSAIVVEWNRQLWNHIDEMGKFEFVEGDELVMKEVTLPDNSYTYATSEEEAKELIDNWYKKHKGEK